MTTAVHGYVSYTGGCRCDVCRAAKAEYMRTKRRAARDAAAQVTTSGEGPAIRRAAGAHLRSGAVRYVAPGVTHGIAASYAESGCRCLECTTAASAKRRDEWRRHRDRQATR